MCLVIAEIALLDLVLHQENQAMGHPRKGASVLKCNFCYMNMETLKPAIIGYSPFLFYFYISLQCIFVRRCTFLSFMMNYHSFHFKPLSTPTNLKHRYLSI